MRVAIVGAGAMGCLFAARLVEAGAQVVLIDVNAPRLLAIKQEGLRLVDDHGDRVLRPSAKLARDVEGPFDLIILFTKGVHSAAALDSIKHLAQHDPITLTLQNGVGNAELLADLFGPERVLMGTAHVPADLSPPNVVSSHGFAELHLGGYCEAAQSRAQRIAALLCAAKFDAIVTDDVNQAIWVKLAFNAALNALAMVTQSDNGAMNNAPALRIARGIVAEAAAVAKGLGIELDEDGIALNVERALVGHPEHKASMLQDREACSPTEIEFINGAIEREGLRLGVPTPVTSTLADLVRMLEIKEPPNA